MKLNKIDPSLSALLAMTPEELAQVAAAGQMALTVAGAEAEVRALVTTSAALPDVPGVTATNQVGNIITVTMTLDALGPLSELAEVVYIEPVRAGRPLMHRTRGLIGASVADGRSIRAGAEPWDGSGVTVGVIDSGFDLRHPAFRTFPGGPTRVAWYWDRTITARPGTADTAGPGGVGVVYDRAAIDSHLLGPAASPLVLHPNTVDVLGHGSHVAGIAAGRGGPFRGVAPGATLVLVRLRDADIGEIHNLCAWIFGRAGGACAINISQGNTSGPHDGTSAPETGLDALLRTPATLAPVPGRFIALAAGNDRQEGWHVRATVLPSDPAAAGVPPLTTQLVWVSPPGNDRPDELVLWYAGLDDIRVRVRAPLAAPNLTHWVRPDGAGGSLTEAVAGGIAPTPPGAGPANLAQRFDFAGGASVTIRQNESNLNGDRLISITLSPAAGGIIPQGLWLIELEGANGLPAAGVVNGFLSLTVDVPGGAPAAANTRLFRPALTARALTVQPGAVAALDIVQQQNVQRPVRVELTYPEGQALLAQVRPGAVTMQSGALPSAWVRHGPAVAALPGSPPLAAPGAATAAGLPFNFAGTTTNINHRTVNGRRRITVEIAGAPPDIGIYRINLQLDGGDRPVEVEARIIQDHAADDEFSRFRDEPSAEAEVEVFPAACIESLAYLSAGAIAPTLMTAEVAVPGGGLVDVRVQIPPADPREETGGWRFTPWVGPGNVEAAVAGSLPAAGGGAGPRIYATATAEVEIDYAAPSAGADGLATVALRDPGGGMVHSGTWRLEFRGRGAAPVTVKVRHAIPNDFTIRERLPSQADPAFGRQRVHLLPADGGAAVVPFRVFRGSGDTIQLELLYESTTELRARLLPPAPDALPFTVATGDVLAVDAGAASPAAGADGVTATLSGGSVVVISMPRDERFPGRRAALVTLRGPAAGAAFHPQGTWRLQVERVGGGGPSELVARIAADGDTAALALIDVPNDDFEQGALRVPATAREVLTVANADPAFAPVLQIARSSSPGPARHATQMTLNGAARPWLPYAKPEITAPGTGIVSVCSSMFELHRVREDPLAWATVVMPDGQRLGMRATWPLLRDRAAGSDAGRFLSLSAAPGATAGFVIPAGVRVEARLVVRYPAGAPIRVRVELPGGAGRTNLVRPDGGEDPAGGAGAVAGAAAPPSPDGQGRVFRLANDVQVFIRQSGAGRATVVVRPAVFVDTRPDGEDFWNIRTLQAGEWLLAVDHGGGAAGPTDVTVEAEPPLDPHGWPKFLSGAPPRASLQLQPIAAPATIASLPVPLTVPERLAGDVTVTLTYPTGAGAPAPAQIRVLAASPGNAQATRGVDATGAQHVEPGTGPIDIAGTAAGGAVRFGFTDGTRVSIAHTPGVARVTFSRGTSAAACVAPGQWRVALVNHDAAVAAPVPVTVNLSRGPHDAPVFVLDEGDFPSAFGQPLRLTGGAFTRIPFRLPEGRRRPLALDLTYDARDTVRVQLETPGNDRTEPVYINNTFDRTSGATLNNISATPAGGVLYTFTAPDGSFFLQVDHRPHPDTGGARNRVRMVFQPRDGGLLRAGNWRLIVFASAIGAGSDGAAEVWFEDMLYRQDSGTSMAAPHIAGLAALMLQQEPTATNEMIKQRMLSTARPIVLTTGGAAQLPNQWDPAAGWGMVDGAAALLGHGGGALHNRGAAPAAVGRTTGCPVACQDNCLIEGVREGGNVIALRASPAAPYSHAPDAPGADPLPPCPRLEGYLARYHGQPFAGGERAAFETLPSLSLRQPLKRSRDQRGTLNGFVAVTWDALYTELAERLVEQWADTGGVVVMEGRPDAGLVRELLFNRFVHHLHRLLGASNTVTKCSFTTKRDVSVAASRVPFGSLSAGAAEHGLRELLKGAPAPLHGRADLSLSESIVIWGANLPATAQALWRTIGAARAARGGRLKVFVIDPGLRELPPFVRRISLAPGSDRHLALALMVRIVGSGGAVAADPRFADATRGIKRFLDATGEHLDAFIGHVRSTAGAYLKVDAGRVVPDTALINLCLPGASEAERARFANDLDALYQAYMAGPTATILGSGPSRYVGGEEHTQYLAALAFLSGNLGVAGGGVSFGEDRHAAFNTAAFAGAHDTARPADDSAEQGDLAAQETLNIGSLAADAPENTKVLLWFDLDPLTHLPDAAATESLLRRTQLNIQVAPALDDSSRFADYILPLGDTLLSYDLQMARRSPFVNLTQPLKTPDDTGPRPSARILHELLAAARARLTDQFEDDLKPTINENIYRTGALLLPRARRQELAQLFEDANRIPNLLRDALPGDEVANIHGQLRAWFRGVHGGQPTAETDTALTIGNQVAFFNRLQVEWVLEVLLARYGEREGVMHLYRLLQRGTTLDTARFNGTSYGVLPDGGVPLGRDIASGTARVDLKGGAGFAAERPSYAGAVQQVDGGATGRTAFPMRLIVAEARAYPSTHIPLGEQVRAGAVQLPTLALNPNSPSFRAGGQPRFADGSRVALVGNVAYAAGRTFETVIARAVVQFDESLALETVVMPPGWHGFDRGGQRLARGVHSEEGEVAALFDNLVRVERENYAPAGNAADRGQRPAKR